MDSRGSRLARGEVQFSLYVDLGVDLAGLEVSNLFPHEDALIRAFVRAERQDRYLTLLSRKGGRVKFVNTLAHFRDFDPEYLRAIPPGGQNPSGILTLLRGLGAPESCYVISENATLDGQTLPLSDALLDTVGYGNGTVLSCRPGSLAYYEGEDVKERYLLVRKP
jgi:hypothetical protein